MGGVDRSMQNSNMIESPDRLDFEYDTWYMDGMVERRIYRRLSRFPSWRLVSDLVVLNWLAGEQTIHFCPI